jgi:hypothetical protein
MTHSNGSTSAANQMSSSATAPHQRSTRRTQSFNQFSNALTKMVPVYALSDSLELKEVQKMFIHNHIDVDFSLLKGLFMAVSSNPGSLSLEEFKKFSLSEEAKESIILNRIQKHDEGIKNKIQKWNLYPVKLQQPPQSL